MRALKIKIETADDDSKELLNELHELYEDLGTHTCPNTLCQDKPEHTIRDCVRYYETLFDIAYKRGGPLYHLIEHVHRFLECRLEVENAD